MNDAKRLIAPIDYFLDVLNSGVVSGEYKLWFLSRTYVPNLAVCLLKMPWLGKAHIVSLNFPRVVCIRNYADSLQFVDIDALHFFIEKYERRR